VSPSRWTVFADAGPGSWDDPLRGDLDLIVPAFRQLRHRQLVILGAPGAGKTVLAMWLTLGLLRSAEPDEPTPVLLPVVGWNPAEEGLEAFLVRRLRQEYDGLGRLGPRRVSLARELVAQELVLPVLDGVDELPAELRPAALAAISAWANAGRPLVVTCRSAEYESLIRSSGAILNRAAVVEIEPVEVGSVIAFLSEPAVRREHWQPVFDHLEAYPDGTLGSALSTPLMVSMARSAYRRPQSEPAELLALPGREAVLGVLMDQFVAGAYGPDRPPRPDRGRWHRTGRYRPEQASRWLSRLALQLQSDRTTEFNWWRLRARGTARRPRAERAAAVTAVTALGGLALWVAGAGPATPGWAFLAACALAGLVSRPGFRPLFDHGYPPYVPLTYRSKAARRRRRWALGALFGLACGLFAGLGLALPAGSPPGALVGALCGAAAGLVTAVIGTVPLQEGRPRQVTPRLTMRLNARNAASAAAVAGFTALPAYAVAAIALAPAGRLSGVVLAGTAVHAVAAGLAGGVVTWLRYRAEHALLVLRGELPVRLWAFLDDAYRERGVLRRTGTSWQFRHVLLQERLARRWHPDPEAEEIRDVIAAADAAAVPQPARPRLVPAPARIGASARPRGTRPWLGDLVELIGNSQTSQERWMVAPLIELLIRTGDAPAARDLLESKVKVGQWWVIQPYVELAFVTDAGEQALATLDRCVQDDCWWAIEPMVDVLTRLGRSGERVTVLQRRFGGGDLRPAALLAEELVRAGEVDQALGVLAAALREGQRWAVHRSIETLIAAGRGEEALDFIAGHWDNDDDEWAPNYLRWLVAAQETGPLAVAAPRALRAIGAGPWRTGAAVPAARVPGGPGEVPVARAADQEDARFWSAYEGLVRAGRIADAVTVLRPRSAAGDWQASSRLVPHLLALGRPDEAVAVMRTRAEAGDQRALGTLPDVLIQAGRAEEAMTLIRGFEQGLREDQVLKWVDLLIAQGLPEEALSLLQHAGDGAGRGVTRRLTDLLLRYERDEEAVAILAASRWGHEQWAVERLLTIHCRRGATVAVIELLWGAEVAAR
jgi:hypothetical protein